MKLALVALLVSSGVTASNCRIQDSNELIKIIKENHPEIKYNESLGQAFSERLGIAKQLPNPELEASREQGKSLEGSTKRTSLGLIFPIEVGGKREARKVLAINAISKNKQNLRLSSEDAFIKSILNSYRLRQIHELIPLLSEAEESLNKILFIKRSRKTLSPEEEVEKETLSLATNDYRLKIARLISERERITSEITLSIGTDCSISLNSLPATVDLSETFNKDIGFDKSALFQQAQGSVAVARAKKDLASANSYPDFKVGPTIEFEQVGGSNFKTYGVSLTMELPILNLNSAERRSAASEYKSSLLNQKHINRHISIELNSEIEKYNRYKKSLNTIANKAELERKHTRIEKLFKRGVISTSMIIESHRQLI
ncbi:TolC family protein, partial [Halobacteriovorax sp.]|uniref:TolC family protein n=1 Tax=Halobacteriovorax sp. TaxID=2020862 RepID=UPI0035622B0D